MAHWHCRNSSWPPNTITQTVTVPFTCSQLDVLVVTPQAGPVPYGEVTQVWVETEMILCKAKKVIFVRKKYVTALQLIKLLFAVDSLKTKTKKSTSTEITTLYDSHQHCKPCGKWSTVGTACSNTEWTLWLVPQYHNKQLCPSKALFSHPVQWKLCFMDCTKPLIKYYLH
jgi:hypothetical protein